MAIRQITLEALHRTHDNLSEHPELNKQMRGVYLALAVLNEFMGEDWVARYVLPGNQKRSVLSLDETNQLSSAKGHTKIVDLAEVLYNLQGVEGVDGCMDRLRSGDIEGTLAELDLGRMLLIHDIAFRYVMPKKIKGQDYDIVVTLRNGISACADAKCKIEGRQFSTTTLKNTFKKGRTQFPEDQPAILFVKHPFEWHENADTLGVMRDVAIEFFRSTERIVSVKYYVQPIYQDGGDVRQRLGFKEFSNPKTRFGNDVDWSIFNTPNNLSVSWQRIGNFPDGARE